MYARGRETQALTLVLGLEAGDQAVRLKLRENVLGDDALAAELRSELKRGKRRARSHRTDKGAGGVSEGGDQLGFGRSRGGAFAVFIAILCLRRARVRWGRRRENVVLIR